MSDYQQINYGLAEVLKVEPVAYEKAGKMRLGYDPESIRALAPELVSELPNGVLLVDSAAFTTVLINAVKELASKLELAPAEEKPAVKKAKK